MPTPLNVKEIQCVLGMATYLTKFLPNLSDVCEPMRRLTKKEVEFTWSIEQQRAFEELKRLTTVTPILRYYDVNELVQIECDASSFGLGAVLKQLGQPVMYASRTLTPTEQNYAHIEKECLAIVFSCTRFDQYVCGKVNVEVETDHQPLINIFTKSVLQATKRIQRMMLRLQRYDIKLKYKKGKEMFIADLLSRKCLQQSEKIDSQIEQVYSVHQSRKRKQLDDIFIEIEQINLIQDVPVDDQQLKQIRLESAQDPEIQLLMKTCQQGWPNQKATVNPVISAYWRVRDELTFYDGFVLRGERIVIPKNLRAATIEIVHYGHIGIESSLRRAREAVYWPNMNDQIKSVIQNCATSLESANQQCELPLQSSPIPELPFQRINLDICELPKLTGNSKDILLIASDTFSDWIEVDELKNMTALIIIAACKRNFSRHGIPSVVVAD